MKKFRGLGALLAGLLIALSAYATPVQAMDKMMKMELNITVKDDKHADMDLKLMVTNEFLKLTGGDITELCQNFEDSSSTVKQVTEGEYTGCQVSAKDTVAMDEGTIKHEGDYYVFSSKSSKGKSDLSELGTLKDLLASVKVSVTFPGKVVEHSGSSTVSGTTVTWTSIDDLAAGISAKAEDKASVASVAAEKKGGLPVWAWALLGLVVVGGAIATVIVVTKSKKKNAAQAPMGYPQPGQPYGTPQQPYGQALYGQPGAPQAPQQFGQSGAPQAPQQFGQSAPYGQPSAPQVPQPGQPGQPDPGASPWQPPQQ